MTRFDEIYAKTHPEEKVTETELKESPVENFDEEESEEPEVNITEGDVVAGEEPEEGEDEDA